VHDPGRHAHDCTTRHEVTVEGCSGVWDDAGEAADDAEGEAEGFFDAAGLEFREISWRCGKGWGKLRVDERLAR
jgi:hypothetical protein